MEQYQVNGMSCAACVARVEKAVNAVDGVSSCAVSLLTNSMSVEGGNSKDIIKAVKDAGYSASLKGANNKDSASRLAAEEEALEDHETPVLRRRLIISLIFLAVLMYFSMGHMMFGWPIPSWFAGNHVAMGLVQMILSAIIMLINHKFFTSGFKALIHRAPNMDSLVALGSMTSFVWSVVVLFLMTDAVVKGDEELVMTYMDEFYFESAAMIVTLITVGKMLESMSKGRTTDALKSLMKLAPQKAVIIKNNQEVEVDIDEVVSGDVFVVKPGESVPVDGIILEGSSAFNESALTGESIPVDKGVGDNISAATINQSGYIKAQATRVGEDTTLSQIIKMVSDAAASKAPIAKIADKVAGVFVPTVMAISLVTFIVWLLIGQTVAYALARAISVLVISCPCSLGLATPVAIMVGNGVGAKNGILFKTASSLEETGKGQIVVLDKTGTITSGNPQVTDIIEGSLNAKQLLQMAYSLEAKSEHPLAKAIVAKAVDENTALLESSDFQALTGNGVRAKINGQMIYGGSGSFIQTKVELTTKQQKQIDDLALAGKTPLLFCDEKGLLGIIAVADTIKEDSIEAIKQLKKMGIKTVMLTGDNQRTADAIGKQVGVDQVIAGVLPDGKQEVVMALQKYGKVIMVGDGINDAPALTRADTGIAIGAGTDVAIDAADVVLMKSSLLDVPAAIRLSKRTLINIYENLFWAFCYNSIGIPIAAGCFVGLGLTLNPMFGAACMSLSSFCVVSNALRLNFVKIYDDTKDKKIKNEIKEEIKMFGFGQKETKTLTVNGMMCQNCERHVKTALEKIDGISEAVADHNNNSVVITLTADVSEEAIKQAVTEEGYEYVGMN